MMDGSRRKQEGGSDGVGALPGRRVIRCLKRRGRCRGRGRRGRVAGTAEGGAEGGEVAGAVDEDAAVSEVDPDGGDAGAGEQGAVDGGDAGVAGHGWDGESDRVEERGVAGDVVVAVLDEAIVRGRDLGVERGAAGREAGGFLGEAAGELAELEADAAKGEMAQHDAEDGAREDLGGVGHDGEHEKIADDELEAVDEGGLEARGALRRPDPANDADRLDENREAGNADARRDELGLGVEPPRREEQIETGRHRVATLRRRGKPPPPMSEARLEAVHEHRHPGPRAERPILVVSHHHLVHRVVHRHLNRPAEPSR
mmetsp:Transcript_19179/g.60317  ORF Transcript_19179/g.60317 Transcript_19179/m.60317 type:complete len:314 (+) Transcript_19179:64-1005(+)